MQWKSGNELERELWLSFELQQNAETRHYFLYNIYSKNAATSAFVVSDFPFSDILFSAMIVTMYGMILTVTIYRFVS